MVEVLRTDVNDASVARLLILRIQQAFPEYEVNFDLDDCDHILRVKCKANAIDVFPLVLLLKECGYYAEVLPDLPPVWPRDFRCSWHWRPQQFLKTV